MNFTRHAQSRSQQRCIPDSIIDLIMEYGNPKSRPGGAIEYCVSRKEISKIIFSLKRFINNLDKAADKAVILKDGNVVTVYHKFN